MQAVWITLAAKYKTANMEIRSISREILPEAASILLKVGRCSFMYERIRRIDTNPHPNKRKPTAENV